MTKPAANVLNGRFKGGYITRRHGKPGESVHAVQLEMAECMYMQETSPYTFDAGKAVAVRPILREQLAIARDWAMAGEDATRKAVPSSESKDVQLGAILEN